MIKTSVSFNVVRSRLVQFSCDHILFQVPIREKKIQRRLPYPQKDGEKIKKSCMCMCIKYRTHHLYINIIYISMSY